MKKTIFMLFVFAAFCAFGAAAQEEKPVIGLAEITVQNGFRTAVTGNWRHIVKRDSEGKVSREYPAEDAPTVQSVIPMIRAAISQEIVNSGRFAVMERSADELNKIRMENLETSGKVNPNSKLDFMLTSELVQFSADRNDDAEKTIKMGLSIKFINVASGQIVVSETFSNQVGNAGGGLLSGIGGLFTGSKKQADVNDCAVALAKDLIGKIVEKIYPPIVLSVNAKNHTLQISNAGFTVGEIVEVYAAGEPILDPYTGKPIGYEEDVIGQVVVYEINNQIAKAMADPKGDFASVQFERGMNIRSTGKTSAKSVKNIKRVLGSR